jgi:hypothetical protein
MAEFIQYDKGLQKQWDEWVASRPEIIQVMCRSHPGNRLYRLKTTGQLVTMVSYYEDGTVKVFVDPKFNHGRLFTGQAVFSIKLEDLEEVNLPDGCEVEKRTSSEE